MRFEGSWDILVRCLVSQDLQVNLISSLNDMVWSRSGFGDGEGEHLAALGGGDVP